MPVALSCLLCRLLHNLTEVGTRAVSLFPKPSDVQLSCRLAR